MSAIASLGRDRLLALLAVFVFGVSALPFIGWYSDLAGVLPRAPDPLSALDTPITLLFESPGSAGTNAVPSLVWIPLLLAFFMGVGSFLSTRLRRVLYILCGLLGLGTLTVLYLQFGRFVSAADLSGTMGRIALGQWIFLAGCLVAIVAGILVPAFARPGHHEATDSAERDGPETGAHDPLGRKVPAPVTPPSMAPGPPPGPVSSSPPPTSRPGPGPGPGPSPATAPLPRPASGSAGPAPTGWG